jgi:ATP/ADP translocase
LPQGKRVVSAQAADETGPTAKDSGFLGISALTWQKVIPLGLMFFFILFNYTLLRNTKVSHASKQLYTSHQQRCKFVVFQFHHGME